MHFIIFGSCFATSARKVEGKKKISCSSGQARQRSHARTLRARRNAGKNDVRAGRKNLRDHPPVRARAGEIEKYFCALAPPRRATWWQGAADV